MTLETGRIRAVPDALSLEGSEVACRGPDRTSQRSAVIL